MSELQRQFALYCREGERMPEGVRQERMPVYRRLVLGNVRSLLSNLLPLSKRLAGEHWEPLICRFVAECSMSHYAVWRMPIQFVEVVCDWEEEGALTDLLRFEVLDHELRWCADEPTPLYTREGDPLRSPLILNPEHRLAAFRYPVFKVAPLELNEPGAHYLLLFRHPDTLRVQLIELSPLWLLTLQHLREEPLSGRDVLDRVATQAPHLPREELLRRGERFFLSLLEERALLGYSI